MLVRMLHEYRLEATQRSFQTKRDVKGCVRHKFHPTQRVYQQGEGTSLASESHILKGHPLRIHFRQRCFDSYDGRSSLTAEKRNQQDPLSRFHGRQDADVYVRELDAYVVVTLVSGQAMRRHELLHFGHQEGTRG